MRSADWKTRVANMGASTQKFSDRPGNTELETRNPQLPGRARIRKKARPRLPRSPRERRAGLAATHSLFRWFGPRSTPAFAYIFRAVPAASFTFTAPLRRLLFARPYIAIGGTMLLATASAFGVPLASESPFLPHADANSATATADSAYEFVGMTTMGDETLISVTRMKDKVSVWIPVGKTVSEITAVSYDPKADRAVIRAGGQTLTLTMRKASVVVGPLATPLVPAAHTLPAPAGPMSDAAIVAGLPSKPISAQEQKEFEARMMVSDLLEIGQQQRRAYEEAQRKAAAAAKARATPPSSTVPAATAPAAAPSNSH